MSPKTLNHNSTLTSRLLTACILSTALLGCGKTPESTDDTGPANPEKDEIAKYFLDRKVSEVSVKKIETFCGDCHGMPRVASFPITHWRKEVERGFGFYNMSGRSDLDPPNLYDTIAYFTQQAESEDTFFEKVNSVAASQELKKLFTVDPSNQIEESGIANILFTEIRSGGTVTNAFLTSDMVSGKVCIVQPDSATQQKELLKGQAPVNATVCDIDQDGNTDVIVSDLGMYKATDSTRGSITLLHAKEDGYEKVVLREKIGRVCQTVVADFDNDGKSDILVGEFGYFFNGSIVLMRRTGDGFQESDFTSEVIDSRHGVVRIVPHDFDQDGDIDFAAAIAQEFETVEIFINDGTGNFTPNKIFQADFPSYGTSGIVLVDLDQDGDQDLLYTNGDTFDSSLPKDYHSIQWLENQGKLKFKHHHITHMPGVHCAKAADFDQDGDLDIVACAFMQPIAEAKDYDSIVYLENNGGQIFSKYSIEKNNSLYPNLEIGDFDENGKTDFVVGTASMIAPSKKQQPLKIYWNK